MTTSFLENNASMANNILSMFSNARQLAFSYIETTVEALCEHLNSDYFTIDYTTLDKIYSDGGLLLVGFNFINGEATCILMNEETGEVFNPYTEDSEVNLEDIVNLLMTVAVNLSDSIVRH